jgi:hypothetical protein
LVCSDWADGIKKLEVYADSKNENLKDKKHQKYKSTVIFEMGLPSLTFFFPHQTKEDKFRTLFSDFSHFWASKIHFRLG